MKRHVLAVSVLLGLVVLGGCNSFGPTKEGAANRTNPINWTTYLVGNKMIECPGPADDLAFQKVSAALSAQSQKIVLLTLSGSYEEIYQIVRPHASADMTDKLIAVAIVCRQYVQGLISAQDYAKFSSDTLGPKAGAAPGNEKPQLAGKPPADPEVFTKHRRVTYELKEVSRGSVTITATNEFELLNESKSTAYYVPKFVVEVANSRIDGIWVGRYFARNSLGDCTTMRHSNGDVEYRCPQQEIESGKSLAVKQRVTYLGRSLANFSFFDTDVFGIETRERTELVINVPDALSNRICVKVAPIFEPKPNTYLAPTENCSGGTWTTREKLMPTQGFKIEMSKRTF